MRYGLQASRVSTLDELRQAVNLPGFEALFLPDHLVGTPLAVGPTLATAAALSPNLQIGAMVYANDFRHPLILAREAATLQQLTGRFLCGLGTGWNEREYRAAGIELDPPATRVTRLAEAVHILKKAWGGEEFSFSGEFYQIERFAGTPVARPRLMLGGGGRRLVTLAGQEADMVNLNAKIGPTLDVYTLDRLEEQLGWLGPSQAERTLTIFYGKIGPDTSAELEHHAYQRGFTVEQARRSPLYLYGTLDQARERVQMLERDYGIEMLILSQWGCDLESFAPLIV